MAVLPPLVQEHITQTLSRRAGTPARSAVLPLGLMVTLQRPLAELVSAGRLLPSLARWIGESELKVPGLADRTEDLRALVLDQLARMGLRENGEPIGIDSGALRLIAEHSWPANELELSALLVRAASAAQGPKLTMADLAHAGLGTRADDVEKGFGGWGPKDKQDKGASEASDHTPQPPLLRRARPRRFIRSR